MKHYVFILTMPGRGSWNGRWTGENNLYARVRSFKKQADGKYPVFEKSYGYFWNDGWSASIEVKEIKAPEKAKLLKQSKGFCGYEWMISSIIEHGEIRKPEHK